LFNKSIDFADDTQDPEEDEHQLSRIKDWFSSCHLQTVEITDVLANFPDISMVTLIFLQLKEITKYSILDFMYYANSTHLLRKIDHLQVLIEGKTLLFSTLNFGRREYEKP